MSPFVTPAYGRQVYLPNGLNKLSHTLVAIRFQVLDKSRANDRALAMGYCRLIGFCIADSKSDKEFGLEFHISDSLKIVLLSVSKTPLCTSGCCARDHIDKTF